ncbi:MAG: LysM domain-containing protein [Pseudomonadota bacterium]
MHNFEEILATEHGMAPSDMHPQGTQPLEPDQLHLASDRVANLYDTIYLEENSGIDGGGVLFRCGMVVAAALMAFGGLQFYKGYQHERLYAAEISPAADARNAPAPGIDPINTSSIGNSRKVVELADQIIVDTTTTYVIQSGDTLSAISKKHGVSVQRIMAANGIDNPRLIKPGMKLKIEQ